MEENFRRDFLKKSGIALGTIVSGSTASAARETQSKKSSLRLRGNKDDPIKPAEIEEKRERIVRDLAASNGGGRSHGTTAKTERLNAGRSSLQVLDGDVIVAYNFDVVDGGTSEHVITVPLEPMGEEEHAEHAKYAEEVSDEELVSAAHQMAKEDAESRNAIKKSTDDGIQPQEVEVDWSDWKLVDKSNNSRVGYQNKTGWNVEWRSPEGSDKHGVRTLISMDPAGYRLKGKWSNHSAQAKIDFKETTPFGRRKVDVEPRNYGPGNTIGSGSSGFEVNVSSDKVLNFGYSDSETDSDLQVTDNSDVFGPEKIVHDYNISNDLRQSTVRMNSAAVADVYDTSGTFANIDLKTKYDAFLRYNIDKSIEFTW
ncbi:hypothetical protein IL252_06770 [Halomicrobium sp. IBSBa]|uniref:hypothetical protein n=1 Tax=Halomicrobium sp. IBSBa TaxID=2778916 RepID=UPI001AC00296|nr:hypothetical protein [Halomicrobium sp. IBSBa]MBO4247519.1 hypothetical protein [Halomicrobium sp. IBSBa]